MKDYIRILNDNENVLWEGKPRFAPFFARSFSSIPVGIFILSIVWSYYSTFFNLSSRLVGSQPLSINLLFMIPFAVLGISAMMSPIYRLFEYSNVYYVITDKRVLMQNGVIGRDFQIIDFDKIQSAEVNVGIVDKLLGGESGSIYIDTGRVSFSRNNSFSRPYILHHISKPYDVFSFFKKVSHDVKTDIQYPNALRPQSNPGYKTELETK